MRTAHPPRGSPGSDPSPFRPPWTGTDATPQVPQETHTKTRPIRHDQRAIHRAIVDSPRGHPPSLERRSGVFKRIPRGATALDLPGERESRMPPKRSKKTPRGSSRRVRAPCRLAADSYPDTGKPGRARAPLGFAPPIRLTHSLTRRGIARRNRVPQTLSEEKPFIARSAAQTAITTGRYLDSTPPMPAKARNEIASGMRTSARQKPTRYPGARTSSDLGGRGGTGMKGFTPDDRSAHLLNFCRFPAAEGGRGRPKDGEGAGGTYESTHAGTPHASSAGGHLPRPAKAVGHGVIRSGRRVTVSSPE